MRTPPRDRFFSTPTDHLRDVKIGECFYSGTDAGLWFRTHHESHYTHRGPGDFTVEKITYLCVRLQDGRISHFDHDTPVRPVEHEVIERLATDS